MEREWCGSHPEFRFRRPRGCVSCKGIQHIAKQNGVGLWASGAEKFMDLSLTDLLLLLALVE